VDVDISKTLMNEESKFAKMPLAKRSPSARQVLGDPDFFDTVDHERTDCHAQVHVFGTARQYHPHWQTQHCPFPLETPRVVEINSKTHHLEASQLSGFFIFLFRSSLCATVML